MQIKKYCSICILLIFIACSQTENSTEQVSLGFEFATRQLQTAIKLIDNLHQEGSPHSLTSEGELKMVPAKTWTSGFFPGELWYLYEYTSDPYWERQARRFTIQLEDEKWNAGTHDMGFKMFCSFGNGFRLTRDEQYRSILLQSARTLIKRYNPTVGCIRSWDHHQDIWRFPVIIDNMMNLELLFWAFDQTRDSTFYDIAVQHARTTLKHHFREDFSSYHVIDYDPDTGEVLHHNTHQGYSHESIWARGQAWGLYGYTMCYRETQLEEFLDQAIHIADFITTYPKTPEDLIPYWDYLAPEIPHEPRDASAASITASALYELSKYCPADQSIHYKNYADKILSSLLQSYRAPGQNDGGFLLLHSTGSKPGNTDVDTPLIYADYYFLEALLRKKNIES